MQSLISFPWVSPHGEHLCSFLRISFTLITEGVIFLLFGFRTKRDTAVFLTVNILTQAALNVIILTEINTSFMTVELIFLEIVIFIIGAAAYCSFFTERSKDERVVFPFTANIANLFIGGAAIYRFRSDRLLFREVPKCLSIFTFTASTVCLTALVG